MDGNTVSVERVIKSSPDKVFALLADAGKHASFDGSDSLNRASQPSVPLSMGSQFGMAMRGRKQTLFVPYRTNNTVIEYELDPADGGTLVRETWDVSQDKQKRMITGGSMPKLTEDGMRATLDRIAALLES